MASLQEQIAQLKAGARPQRSNRRRYAAPTDDRAPGPLDRLTMIKRIALAIGAEDPR